MSENNIMAKIKNIRESRNLGKQKILRELYNKVCSKILEYEKSKTSMCIFHIPDYIPDCPAVNVPEAANWLMTTLNNEGFKTMSLEGTILDIEVGKLGRLGTVNDILIIWTYKESNIYLESKINFNEMYDSI